MDQLIFRHEQETDHRRVEEVTRDAFWNLYIPGCDEHCLVHMIRKSPDFLPALSFVAELNGQVVGSIFFTKSYILDESGTKHDTITFGPVCVLPKLHNQGIGRALIAHAKQEAMRLGYRAILIHGYPGYYKRLGFRHAKEFCISNPEGKYPLAHLVLELYEGALRGISGKAFESEVFHVSESFVQEYDATFEPKKKEVTEAQQVFLETAASFL